MAICWDSKLFLRAHFPSAFARARHCPPPRQMSDYSFMRSGRLPEQNAESVKPLLRKMVSILKVLSEEAADTAVRFAKACGRTAVTGQDMLCSLKYESQAFWEKDIDARFLQHLREENEHTYETDEEESGEEESGEEESGEEESGGGEESGEEESGDEESGEEECGEEEAYTLVCSSDHVFHAAVLHAVREFDHWEPADPLKAIMKNAILKASAK